MTGTVVTMLGWQPRTVTPPNKNGAEAQVAILLSLYNGEAFLNRQLDSLLEQSFSNWILVWRDDGSTDASRAIMLSFQAHRGAGRCIECVDPPYQPPARLGITASYARLIEAVPPGHIIAFADQDDVWLPGKLARGVAAFAMDEAAGSAAQSDRPALYCARQILTDRALNVTGMSPLLPKPDGVMSALAQNLATGCTVMLNDRGRELLCESLPAPPGLLHDWWAYLLISAAGGIIHIDNEPSVFYRQHGSNAVGAPSSYFRRAISAMRRGPTVFMDIFRANTVYLLEQPDKLSPDTKERLEQIQAALRGTLFDRIRLLRANPSLSRHGCSERVLFLIWFLFG